MVINQNIEDQNNIKELKVNRLKELRINADLLVRKWYTLLEKKEKEEAESSIDLLNTSNI